jgi:cytochrome P450
MDDVATTTEAPAFPMPRSCPLDPPPGYAKVGEEAAVSRITLPTGKSAWLIMGHKYLRQILTDSRVSVNRIHPGYPHLVALTPEALAMMSRVNDSLVGLDPPEHTIHRRMLINEFTVRRFQALRPRIQEIVDERVDRMLAGDRPVDLVEALALPVPSEVISELLGVPREDAELFQQCTLVAFNRKAPLDERIAAGVNLMMYVDKLVTEKEDQPGDDLIGRLVVKYREAAQYDHAHLVGLGMLLLMAGHETTANMISLGTLALLEHPDQLAELKRDPSVTPKAVEELLRYLSIVDISGGSRVALADIEIGGVTIRKGEGLIALLSGANRDGDLFANPDTLDLRRGARQHVAFGYGIHQCIGQNLARLELEVVFSTLFARIPDLRLAVPMEDLPLKDDASIYGILEMPVTW